MSNIAKDRRSKVLQGDTFRIAQEAKTAKQENDRVIDVTVGALFDDDGSFHTFRSITGAIQRIEDHRNYAYPPIDGGKPFRESLMSWVFQDHEQWIKETFSVDLIATPGACGALHNAFLNYMEPEDRLIMPDIYWTNYRAILANIDRTYRTYPMFEQNRFDLVALKRTVEQEIKGHDRIILLFNDPAHNPTGYSLSHSEWQEVHRYASELIESGKRVTIVYDLAYMDYAGDTLEASREIFQTIADVHEDLVMLFAFSGSKSFSIYGQRLGALIAVSKNPYEIDAFSRAARFLARSTWSCPPATGLRLIEDLPLIKDDFIAELKRARETLKARSEIFIQEAAEVGLEHYPYRSGFFVTLTSEDPADSYERLSEQGIYGIPVERGLRLSLSSLSLRDVKGLAKRIKNIL
ncbi:MAG: pyridoxal phosphate-dependent aminotransferase [Acholeplasmataceae bacterium]